MLIEQEHLPDDHEVLLVTVVDPGVNRAFIDIADAEEISLFDAVEQYQERIIGKLRDAGVVARGIRISDISAADGILAVAEKEQPTASLILSTAGVVLDGGSSVASPRNSRKRCHAQFSCSRAETGTALPIRHQDRHPEGPPLGLSRVRRPIRRRLLMGGGLGCGLRGVEIAGEVLESGVDSDGYDCVSGAKLTRNVDRTDDVEPGGCPRE